MRGKHLGIRIIWESHVTPLLLPWCTSVSTKCASFLWSWQLQHAQRETVTAHLCHLHVVNINRLGLCVPAPRQSHITQRATFQALKMKPGLPSYCQNIFNINTNQGGAQWHKVLHTFPVPFLTYISVAGALQLIFIMTVFDIAECGNMILFSIIQCVFIYLCFFPPLFSAFCCLILSCSI